MGRFYSGDINGKFGFGSQSSDDGEYFGAYEIESNIIQYSIDNEDIPKAIEKLKDLVKEFNKDTGKKATIDMTQDDFWKLVDTDWYQDEKHGLLASRVAMGLEIARFHDQYPDSGIDFDAEC